MEMSALALPPLPLPLAWARMNSTDWTNIPPRAAAGVVDAAPVGLEHLDQQAHDAAGGVKLAALLPLGAGELAEEVFVDAAEDVFGARLFAAEADVADVVDEPAEAALVKRGARVVLGQHALERGVVALDGLHGLVHELADRGLFGLALEVRPACLRWHPENIDRAVLVGVLGVGTLCLFRDKLGVLLLEGIGDVLQEDEAQHDVLVLGGVHGAAQGVGHLPELGLVADGGACGLCVVLSFRHGHLTGRSCVAVVWVRLTIDYMVSR